MAMASNGSKRAAARDETPHPNMHLPTTTAMLSGRKRSAIMMGTFVACRPLTSAFMIIPSTSTRPPFPTHASPGLVPRSLARRSYKSSKLNVDGGEGNGWRPQQPEPLRPDAMSTKLLSYASNIRRGRREKEKEKQKSGGTKSISASATRSLLYALRSESEALQQSLESEGTNVMQSSPEAEVVGRFRDALSKAVVSAIRSSADDGDYGLIMKIMDAVEDYAGAVLVVHGIAIVDTRIFGEAITGLAQSNASQSKLKKMWNKFIGLSQKAETTDGGTVLTSAPGPYELNAMIAGLADRKRVRAALDLYRTSGVPGDAFTASILLEMLASSVSDRTGPVKSDSHEVWQWDETVALLEDFVKKGQQLNNYPFASALKVNKQATRLSNQARGRPENRHDGGKATMFIMDQMKLSGITPDVVTCTSILQCLEEAGSWEEAVRFLESMEDASSFTTTKEGPPITLPPPNAFAYASVISVCFGCGQINEAMQLLDRLPEVISSDVTPETWLYNRALQALLNPHRHSHAKAPIIANGPENRFDIAADILRRMKKEERSSPDRITYNTILSATKLRSPSDEHVVRRILSQMTEDGIGHDAVTFRNAIQACRDFPEIALCILNTSDIASLSQKDKNSILNLLLEIAADATNISTATQAFNRMIQAGAIPDITSFVSLSRAFVSSDDGEGLALLLKALQRTDDASGGTFRDKFGIDLHNLNLPTPASAVESLCTGLISSLLARDNVLGTMIVLSSMKSCCLIPSDASLQSIASEYCRLGMKSASDEFKEARSRALQEDTKSSLLRPVQHLSSSYTKAALELSKKMKFQPTKLQCAIIVACYASGRWTDGRNALKQMHKTALNEAHASFDGERDKPTLSELPSLHHQLFKLCARSGNVTSALWISDAVADLSDQLEPSETSHLTIRARDRAPLEMNMCGEDWKLLTIAASKSAHWKVCLSLLELLRPFVEATNIQSICPTNESLISHKNRDYSCLSRGISAATLCFEIRSQYAWAVRAIEDWIEWSGRRPPPEAVSATCRILAKRGKGQQVVSLMSRVLQVSMSTVEGEEGEESAMTYDRIVYNEAIMALYSNGFYERADELYVSAVGGSVLPWAPIADTNASNKEIEQDSTLTLDLHGMTAAIAHSAVRVALQREVQQLDWNATSEESSGRDVIIITGRGRRSERRFRPVVRPEVQRMLVEEFYPPLSTSSVPGNMGALLVPSGDIQAWLEHQKEQKGLRLLTIADMLKDLSSTQRIAQRIALAAQREEEENRE